MGFMGTDGSHKIELFFYIFTEGTKYENIHLKLRKPKTENRKPNEQNAEEQYLYY